MIYCVAHNQRGGAEFCVFCLRTMADRAREILALVDDDEVPPVRSPMWDRLREALEPDEEERED